LVSFWQGKAKGETGMKFYSITWCNYEDTNCARLFTNKRDAKKKHVELKHAEETQGLDSEVAFLSDVKTHHVERLTKQSVVKLFREVL
tara:strand:+ start:266 stop:529 length:264 start_codon:yes stop_codon:yes gene_type:complete